MWRVEPCGRVTEAFRPKWGARALTIAGDRLLIQNGFKDAGPGLYTMGTDGKAAEAVVDEPVISVQSRAVITLADRGHVLRIRDGWARAMDGEALAVVGDTVLAVEEKRIVARMLADGAERSNAVAPADVLTLHAAGGVVFVRHMLGLRLLRAADGRTLGDPRRAWGTPVLAGEVLVIAGEGRVVGATALA